MRGIHTLSCRSKELLLELKGECARFLRLLSQLEDQELPEDQIEELLGELDVSIIHLHTHTDGLVEILDEN